MRLRIHSMRRSTTAPSWSITSNQDSPTNSATSGQPQAQQQQRRAEKAQALRAAVAGQFAKHAAGAVGHPESAPVQGSQDRSW